MSIQSYRTLQNGLENDPVTRPSDIQIAQEIAGRYLSRPALELRQADF